MDLQTRVLKYLRYGNEPTEEQKALVCDAIKEAGRYARPQFVYRFFELSEGEDGVISCPELDLNYPSFQKLLTRFQSDSLCILVSTLGPAIDRRIDALSQKDPAKMVLLDAAANALIEDETNKFQERLGLKEETFRYGPGYGDVPLSMQRAIFDLMPEISKIGIVLDDSNLMHPMKSMTGLIGFKSR
ncbi:MAG: hypothetical protein IKT14_07575 [Clostridiales bacterium]|nr:hypothetical protein [Clostridiales bacterium]